MKKKIIIFSWIVFLIVLFFVFRFLSNKDPIIEPLTIMSSSPKNNEVFVSENTEIIFTLNREISNEEGLEIKTEISPSLKTENVYIGNKIRISPETEFNLNTEYEIRVFFKENLIYTYNFETNPFSKQQIEEEGGKQTQLDLDFNQKYEEFYKNYPWYSKIPIETNKYLIVYDFERELFKVILRVEVKNTEERDLLEKEAVQDIINIGVKAPINNYYLQEKE